jgi:hypothetical protein
LYKNPNKPIKNLDLSAAWEAEFFADIAPPNMSEPFGQEATMNYGKPKMTPKSESSTQPDESQDKAAENTAQADKRFKLAISEGILLAITSAIAYLWAYQYQKGFASYFGVPPEFIEISTSSIVLVIVLLVGSLKVLVLVLNLLVSFVHVMAGPHIIVKRLASVIGIMMFLLFIPVYLDDSRRAWVAFFVMFVSLVLLFFVSPLITARGENGYINKLEKASKAFAEQSQEVSLITLAERRLGPTLTWIILAIVISVFVAHEAGKSTALKQKSFLVMNTPQEMVVLRVYGELMILAPLNREKKEVQKNFVVVKTTELHAALMPEEVGPLLPVNAEAKQPFPLPSPTK